MSFLESFTMAQSAAITVRAEPPDTVCIDEPGRATRRVPRQQIAVCHPMLVRVYRQRHPGTLTGADGEQIVIEFQVTGAAPEVLGPYPWHDGMNASGAIQSAMSDLLLAAPGISLAIAENGSAILFTCSNPAGLRAYTAMGLSTGSVSVPIPTAQLHDVALSLDPEIGHSRLLETGRPGHQYVAFEMLRGPTWLIGPFVAAEAAAVAHGVRAWRAKNPFDHEPVEVTEEQLLAEPTRWHGRRIKVEGTWTYQFESSQFAGVWLSVPDRALGKSPYERRTQRVRVVGTWYYSTDGGYGHMGASPGELRAESLEVLGAPSEGH